MRRVSTAIKIRGPHRRSWLFDKLVDLNAYPALMDGLMGVQPILGQQGTSLSRWEFEVHGCPLGWVQEDLFDPKRLAYRFDGRDGDFEFFTGCWRIKPDVRGSLLVFEACWDVGVPIVEDLLGNSIEAQFRRAITRLMEGFRVGAEGAPLVDTRAAQRLSMERGAGISSQKGRGLGRLVDISESGACLDLGEPRLVTGERFILLLNDEHLPKKVEAEVVWQDRKGKVGLVFPQGIIRLPGREE